MPKPVVAVIRTRPDTALDDVVRVFELGGGPAALRQHGAALIESLLDLAPDTRFATLTRSGYDLLPGPGYLGLMEPGNHGRNP